MNRGRARRAVSYGVALLGLSACGGGDAGSTTEPTVPTPPVGGSTSTAGVLCGLSGSEFNNDESVRLSATFSWTCSSTTRALVSNGVPNHEVGTFPGPGNPNPIGAVSTSASYTLNPALQSAYTGVITSGYALNGVKMEPATAGTCGNGGGSSCTQAGGTGPWTMEALGQTAFNFGTDENNAHVQPSGAYHYHGMPERLITKLGGGGTKMTLIGWAPDGFPIYARHGHSVATDAGSALKVLRGSYRLKSVPDANRPSVAIYPMGAFTQDYEYAAGSGDLDECNGRSGVTPEFPGGIYHYLITDTFPFMGRCVKGTPASIR
jgi:YHYH protein